MARYQGRGIDILSPSDPVVFSAYFEDEQRQPITTGTGEISVFELQEDGTLLPFPSFIPLIHQDQGIWTAVYTPVNFNQVGTYFAIMSHSAGQKDIRRFQWGK